MRGQPGLFDVDDRLKRLSDLGDQLLAFAAAVDFEMFRPELARALAYSDGAQGGRPPFDPVMMFKILVIQAANNLSDERTEFLINDRLSFMRFLGLSLADRVPDARTIWLFREKLTKADAIKTLFERFDAALRQAGYIAMGGQIVDASLIAAPKQRNTEDEKAALKQGRIPETWKAKPAKLRQKDRDARWTVKFSKAKAARRRHQARRRHRDPDLRLSEPHRDRPPARADPALAGERRGGLRRRAAAPGPARQDQHRKRGLGRHGLPVQGQRGVPRGERVRQPHPSQEAAGPADVAPHAAGERAQVHGPLTRRARLCGSEGQDAIVHPHRRDRPGDDQDRHGQSRLQHAAARLSASASPPPDGLSGSHQRPTTPSNITATTQRRIAVGPAMPANRQAKG